MRHGHTAYDVVHRFLGHGRDLASLSTDGVAQSERAAEALVAAPPDAIISSPMTRALQTATIIGHRIDRPVAVEVDLHEWMPDAEQQWHGPAVPTAAYDDLTACGGEWPPGADRAWEPLSAIRARVDPVLDRHGGDLLVVCHSVVIQAMTGVAGCPFVGVVELSRP